MPGPNANNTLNNVAPHKHKMTDILTGNSGLGGAIKKTDSALEKGAVVATAFVRKFGGKVTITKLFLIGLIILTIMGISYYIRTQINLLSNNATKMESEYNEGSTIGSIKSNQGRFSHNLRDYYIASSYNSCCGGNFQNDYVDLEPLKEVIKAGSRLLDFEIYSIDGKPVIGASPNNNYDLKGTYNSIPFSAVMNTIKSFAFSPGFCNNAEDPLFLHFRIKSDNTNIYRSMAKSITKNFNSRLLPTKYGREGRGGFGNIVQLPILNFKGKVVIIAANDSNNYRDTPLEDLVNMSTGTPFLDSKRNYDIQYTHDPQGLKEFNKKNMTLTMPDLSAINKNVPAALHQQYGCQFVCMNYPKLDSNMEYYNNFFSENGTAFVLKPSSLRYHVIKIPNPKPQNPKVSYAKKSISLPMFKGSI